MAVVIFLFSYNAVWLIDDIVYQYRIVIPPADSGERWAVDYNHPIDTLSDVFISQNAHYFCVNGRYLAHFIVQLFDGILGKTAFAVANALIYICFFVLILRLGHSTWRNWRKLLIAIPLGVIFFSMSMSPAFQVGYFWMMTLCMWFLTLFFNDKSRGIGQTVLLCLVAIAAGSSQETLTIGLGIALIIFWARNMRHMTATQWAMLICYGVGLLTLCLAPGSIGRANGRSAYTALWALGNYLSAPYILYILLIFILILLLRRRITLRSFYRENAFYINTAIICIIFNFCVGINTPRQMFGSDLCCLILLIRLLNNRKISFLWPIISCATLFIFWGFQAYNTYVTNINYNEILRRYKASNTGEVYYNFRPPIGFLGIPTYSGMGPGFYTTKETNVQQIYSTSLNHHLHVINPDRPMLQIIPEYLQGKENLQLTSRAIRLDDDTYLLIQSREHPDAFDVNIGMHVLGLQRPWMTVRVDTLQGDFQGDHWRADIFNYQLPLSHITNVQLARP